MKTTIVSPDDLLLKARATAAERRTTLRELMIQGIQLITQTPPEAGEKKRKATLKRLLKGMKATHTVSMKPLTREEIHDRCGLSGFQPPALRLLRGPRRCRHQLSHRDATIVAAATEPGCRILYPEDLSHGQSFGSLRVINPFLPP